MSWRRVRGRLGFIEIALEFVPGVLGKRLGPFQIPAVTRLP